MSCLNHPTARLSVLRVRYPDGTERRILTRCWGCRPAEKQRPKP